MAFLCLKSKNNTIHFRTKTIQYLQKMYNEYNIKIYKSRSNTIQLLFKTTFENTMKEYALKKNVRIP